jgi:hypothetical protein
MPDDDTTGWKLAEKGNEGYPPGISRGGLQEPEGFALAKSAFTPWERFAPGAQH